MTSPPTSSARAATYAAIASKLAGRAGGATYEERMQAIVDAMWDALGPEAVSWVGFYIDRPDQRDDRRLVLGPRRDKPACSPIGLHGVCGQALRAGAIRIVRDVRELGSDYIACDPRDRSEIVIPLLNDRGACWGVLDADSWELGAFDWSDARGLGEILTAAGFRPVSAADGASGHQ